MNEPADIDPFRHARVGKRAASEIALIAAVLAFGWMRPTAADATRARVGAILEAMRAKCVIGMTGEELTAALESLRLEYPTIRPSGVPTFVCDDPNPALRHGLARALFESAWRAGGRNGASGWAQSMSGGFGIFMGKDGRIEGVYVDAPK